MTGRKPVTHFGAAAHIDWEVELGRRMSEATQAFHHRERTLLDRIAVLEHENWRLKAELAAGERR